MSCCNFCGIGETIPITSKTNKALETFVQFTNLPKYSIKAPACSQCYESVLNFNKFISKLIEHQKLSIHPKSNNILKSYKGITIKRIGGHKDPFFETVQVKSEPMEMETCLVKCEPVEMRACLVEETSNFGTTSDDDDDDDYQEDDDDFNPTEKASTSTSSMKKVADLNFTCANCKVSYDDFDTLTQHITSRICSKFLSIKCKFCEKKFDSKRKLYSHHKTHAVRTKVTCKSCPKTFFSQEELKLHMETHIKVIKQGFTFRCIQCRASYNSHLDLILHMKEEHAKKTKTSQSKIVS